MISEMFTKCLLRGWGEGWSLLWAGQELHGIGTGHEEWEHVTDDMEKQNEHSLEEARQAVYWWCNLGLSPLPTEIS